MKPIEVLKSPFFATSTVTEIYRGRFTLKVDDLSIDLEGSLNIDLNKRPRITFDGIERNNNSSTHIDMLKTYDIATSEGHAGKVLVSHRFQNSDGHFLQGAFTTPLFHATSQTMIDKTRFHLVNYEETKLGKPILLEEAVDNHSSYLGGINLWYKEWSIQIQMRYDYKSEQIFESLKNTEGFAFTHVGEISRTTNEPYSKEEVEAVLKILKWSLCLCAGRYVGIGIISHFANDSVIDEEFRQEIASPYKYIFNWFPKHRPELLQDVFYQLSEIMKDPFMTLQIIENIIWNIEVSNETNIQKQVILSQASIESLMFLLWTEKKPKRLSRTKFNSLGNASEKIIKTLEILQIDSRLPKDLNLPSEKFDQIKSGPNLLSNFRNSIAHPSRQDKYQMLDIWEKWKIAAIGKYYQEMMLLYLIDYQGEYSNLLKLPEWEGTYGLVPWARNSKNN
ncbi:hypothetical protein QWY15_12805 [Planococcus sp. N064]|uniref:YopA central domain-containing protein n=1 Tax=Planococcus liqunii TaxID=3058394 RepID=A0ABT8MTE5_9BACL|nr:hypothetical protein [Planococcus sp. N064]MDN7228180.1 hypothetical protein [Planococcus sp. N064]